MANHPRNKGHHGSRGEEPAKQHHGSTAEETAALNETFKAFTKKYDEGDEEDTRRERKRFRLEIALACGVALNIALTIGLLIAGILQLMTMQDTERRQLRAYVGVSAGDVEDFGVPDKQRIHFVRKNYGQTPAYNVGFSTIGSFVVTPANAAFDINTPTVDCVKPGVPGLITMFPTVELPMTLNTQGSIISDKDRDNVKAGAASFVYFGSVCYHDAFGIPHYTHYCFMHKGTGMAAKDADGCLKYNDSN
jgi:hypothetical protein